MNYYLAGTITIFLIIVATFLLMIFAPSSNNFIETDLNLNQHLEDIASPELKQILLNELETTENWELHPNSNFEITKVGPETEYLLKQIPEYISDTGYFFKVRDELHTKPIKQEQKLYNAVLGLKVSNERLCSVWVDDEARAIKNKWIIYDSSKNNAFINDSFSYLYGIYINLKLN